MTPGQRAKLGPVLGGLSKSTKEQGGEMSDNYEAVYAATRSAWSGFSGHSLLQTVVQQFDISYPKQLIQQELLRAIEEYKRPSVLYRPALTNHGKMGWRAYYGSVAGCGETPAQAMADFDRKWEKP